MNIKTITMALLTGTMACACSRKEPVYKDASAPVDRRVEDLLGRMTLEEKVGQMNQFVGLEHIRRNEAHLTEADLKNNTAQAFYPGFPADTIAKWTKEGRIGSFLHVLTLEEANHLQSLAMESRLQIPVIFGIDAIHGNANAPDNTVYPTNIGLASSFNLGMARRIARQTALEMRAMNMHWTFNPNVEVARDPRWGRCGETFGEDPYLVSLMGVESVKGYQGDLGEDDVLACIKHFVGGSQPVNGTNGAPTDLSERTLREVFFPPFREGVQAGAMSLMTAHNELNGIPCHSNEWLMEDVLRGEWGFDGIVMTDWWSVMNEEGQEPKMQNTGIMVRAQNDLFMVTADAETNALHDDSLEAMQEGRTTRAEYVRCAANICRVLMRSPVMDRFLGRTPEDDLAVTGDEDGADDDLRNIVHYVVEDGVPIALGDVDTQRGSSVVFGIQMKTPGVYNISAKMRAGADAPDLSQMSMSIFMDNQIKGTFHINGADREWVKQSLDLGFLMGNHYIKLYFSMSGMELSDVCLEKTKDAQLPF